MENNFDINKIVEVKQLPIVFEQLEKIGTFISEQTKDLDKLECTEENKQEVKVRRTNINNVLKTLEDKRKDIKNKILEPYKLFEEKYEQECKNQLEEASNILKNKIDVIEDAQKREKEDELREFVKQHCEANHIHIEFEAIGLNITLSASMKSLKDQALAFIERVASDLKLIDMEEYKDEILLEYNKSYDFVSAKTVVIERHRKLEELAKQQEERKEIQEQEQKQVEQLKETISIPKEIIEDEELLEISFTIKTTKEKAILLKQFMKDNNIDFQ